MVTLQKVQRLTVSQYKICRIERVNVELPFVSGWKAKNSNGGVRGKFGDVSGFKRLHLANVGVRQCLMVIYSKYVKYLLSMIFAIS